MIELKNVNYKYPSGGGENSLFDFSIQIKRGEFIVLCGKSGCGKTTVTRLINGLIPHFYEGTLTGEVTVNGMDAAKTELSQMAGMVGSVFQNPKSQFFNVDTDGELAFGCENMAMPRQEIASSVKRAARSLALDNLLGRNIFHLSGGEKQQIACGSVYAANPPIYVLDEPSSNMDAKAIGRLQKILAVLKKEKKTVIISEHRLYYLMELADRFAYMQNGKIARCFSSADMLRMENEQMAALGLRSPVQNKVFYTGEQGNREHKQSKANLPAIQIDRLRCRRGAQEVLSIPKLEIPAYSVTAIVGENGAGKSTLFEVLCGFLRHEGNIWFNGEKVKRSKRPRHSYMVMQDVNRQLFCASVSEEVSLGLSAEKAELTDGLLERMGLKSYKDRHPVSLSGGQKQRVAICAAMGAKKALMLYDEPTSGLDFDGMHRLCELIKQNAEKTLSTLIITHDFELVMGCCTHVLRLDKGKVAEFYPLNAAGISKIKSCFIQTEGVNATLTGRNYFEIL